MNKLKKIVGNGLPWGLATFVLGLLIGYVSCNITLKECLQMSIPLGLFTLLVTGSLYSRFTKPVKKLDSLSMELKGTELILIQAPANHLIQDSLVSGKLFLTDQRLVFKAYAVEDGLPQYSWVSHDLQPVDYAGSIWNSGGEFILKAESGSSLMFEVDQLKPWKDALGLRKK